MITEYSCGAVVFTREGGGIQYVIIQSKEGVYGFPKGHREDTETEQETALREIREETGLDVTLIPGFRIVDVHPFTKNGETRMKNIAYFLGEFSGQQPRAQEEELSSIRLMDYEAAMNVFQFESSRRILTEARDFLERIGR